MEIAVLGPLLVSAAGEAVALGAARKRRLVLAVLLARAGQPVPIDVLVDAVWEGRPPASARRNLQLYVHQLRRILGDGTIAARGDGYMIDPGDGLDATRFRRLAVDGAAHLDAGDAAAAHATLRSALDLWRGQAFADFLDCRLVADEGQRLELLRVEAYERWAEARLAVGVTTALAAALTELCRAHPYRESLRGLLMRALYQTGQQAAALAVYRETRALLVAELGVEPGPELRRLHEAMLRGYESPAPRPDVSTVVVAPPPPRQLPAPPQVFTGRLGELAALGGRHDTPTVVIGAIDGMAGVGKTALAIHAAHRIADRYPDGQLFIDLHGYTQGVAPVEPADALDRMLRSLGIPGPQIPATLDERAALYRTRLAEQRMLIVLDNAATEAQVVPLLPGAPGCLVLVTSRRRLAGLDHTHTLTLDTLPVPDAVALLRRTAGEDRLQPHDLLEELVELCGRLPLAIRIAAARLRSHPRWQLSHLVQLLRDRQHRLAELAAGQRSVTAALDLSYQHLSDDQRRTYRMLGLHPGAEFDPYATAALLDSTLEYAGRMLDQLLDAHLLLEPVAGRYRFHDLTRVHAARAATGGHVEPTTGAALDRLLDHYRHTASLAMDAAYPEEREYRPKVPHAATPTPDLPDPAAALAWLDSELANLMAAARGAAERGRYEHIVHLSTILARHLRIRSRYRDAETIHHRALTAALTIGDRAGELTASNRLGWVHRRQGRHVPATDHYQRALQLARALGDGLGEMEALQGLADVYSLQARYARATDYYQRALRLARAAHHPSGEIEARFGLGDIFSLQGRQAPAADEFGHALRLARNSGDRHSALNALNGLGQVHRLQGEHAQAADRYAEALQLARAAGHVAAELNALNGLGDIRRRQGRYAEAEDHYQQLIHRAKESGDRNWQFEAWQGLGRLRQATGDPTSAVVNHDRALALARDLDQPVDEVRAYDGLAHAHRALRQYDHARRHWLLAMDMLGRLGVDRTEDEETNLVAMRTHLAGLDQLEHPG